MSSDHEIVFRRFFLSSHIDLAGWVKELSKLTTLHLMINVHLFEILKFRIVLCLQNFGRLRE